MPYPSDPVLRESTLALLGGVWKKLPRGIERAQRWGADWLQHSEPFLYVEGGESVAHVGVMEIEAVLEGRTRTLAGIHAVCTRADRRGRGLLRDTMRRTLAWVDSHYETAVLWANDPGIYTRFGFAARPEATFSGPLETGGPSPVRPSHRLSLDLPADVDLLRARLAQRAPVSPVCGSREPGWLTLINLGLWPEPGPNLAWLPDLEAIVAYEARDRVLRLYDVIAPAMPSLQDLTARLPLARRDATAQAGVCVDEVAVFFSPEALDAPQLRPVPTTLGDHLMVRGPFLSDSLSFAFSPLTRC